MNRNLERRVVRLEDARRALRGGAYIVWAASQDVMPDAIRAAIVGGHVRPGDPIILGVWSSTEPMPHPRWVARVGELSDDELQILRDIVAASEPGGESDANASRVSMTDYTDGELLAFVAEAWLPMQFARDSLRLLKF